MKRPYTYLSMLFVLFCLFACKKDDKIAIEHLMGNWSEHNDDPNLVIDGSVSYHFNEDKTCSKTIYNALSNRDTTLNWTYVISNDKTLVTMYGKDNIYTEQYKITKLTDKVMEWKNASPGDGNADKKLVRY